MKVLFHIDRGDNWGMTLNNVINMLSYNREMSIPTEIEIVANGPAVCELQSERAERAGLTRSFNQLQGRVRICACNNALTAQAIRKEELFGFVDVVPSGVVELALQQERGFGYIKP